MPEEMYVNKNGFKCVRSQLAKTDGYDPQEYQRQLAYHGGENDGFKNALKSMPVKAQEHAVKQ